MQQKYRIWYLSVVMVVLTVVLSGCSATVPDVVGMEQAAAVSAVEAVHLVAAVIEGYSDTVAAGVVISQNPSAGTSLGTGSTVALVVSLGVMPFGAFPVPDTGQTGDYTANWGEDADYTINPHSYTDLGNGIVRDNVTGLEWVQDGNLVASRDPLFDRDGYDKGDGWVTWQHALEYVAKLNRESYLGYSDWRLPTIKELSSLIDAGTLSPAIDTDFFPDTVDSYYWSSTPDAFGAPWYVGFGYGFVTSLSNLTDALVRAVRAGKSEPESRFVDNGDGTVTDRATGLMWQQMTAPGKYKWEGALLYCEGLELAEYTDWRLPNRNELQSLVDYDYSYPAIDSTFFPDTVMSDDYWSSTIYANNTVNAWSVIFSSGGVGCENRPDGRYYVRAVRAGQ